FGAKTTTVENHGHTALANQAAHLHQDLREHLDHSGVGFGCDDKQWITRRVVDPIVGCRRHRQAHPSYVRLGQTMLAVINADVAIDIEEAQGLSPRSDSTLSQSLAELGGRSGRSQT